VGDGQDTCLKNYPVKIFQIAIGTESLVSAV